MMKGNPSANNVHFTKQINYTDLFVIVTNILVLMALNGVGLEGMGMCEVADAIYLENGKILKVNASQENDKENQTYNKGLMVQIQGFQLRII